MILYLSTIYPNTSFSSSSLCYSDLLVATHSSMLGLICSSICCPGAVQDVWDLSRFLLVLQGGSCGEESTIKRSKIKGFWSWFVALLVPLKRQIVYPTFCSHKWPNLASTYRYFHGNRGLPGLLLFLWAPCIAETGILNVIFLQKWFWIKNIFSEWQVQRMFSISWICEQPETLLPEPLRGSTFARLQKWQISLHIVCHLYCYWFDLVCYNSWPFFISS